MTTSNSLSPKYFAACHSAGVGSAPIPKQMEVASTTMTHLKSFCEVTRPPPPCHENLMDRVKGEHQETHLSTPVVSSIHLQCRWTKFPLGQAAVSADVQEGETQQIFFGPGSAL